METRPFFYSLPLSFIPVRNFGLRLFKPPSPTHVLSLFRLTYGSFSHSYRLVFELQNHLFPNPPPCFAMSDFTVLFRPFSVVFFLIFLFYPPDPLPNFLYGRTCIRNTAFSGSPATTQFFFFRFYGNVPA